MTLIREGQPELHLPAQAHEVYDVTGAGDTVISTLATSLAAGKSLDEACALANTAAGIVVGKLGTSTVSPVELANALYTEQETGLASCPRPSSGGRPGRPSARREGGDDQRLLRHSARGSCLLSGQCGQAGDRLIVAVNTDESVRRLRGRVARSTRPSAV